MFLKFLALPLNSSPNCLLFAQAHHRIFHRLMTHAPGESMNLNLCVTSVTFIHLNYQCVCMCTYIHCLHCIYYFTSYPTTNPTIYSFVVIVLAHPVYPSLSALIVFSRFHSCVSLPPSTRKVFACARQAGLRGNSTWSKDFSF